MSSSITCPGCGHRFDGDDASAQRSIHDTSGGPREWVLNIGGDEIHRCPLDTDSTTRPTLAAQ